MSTYKPAFEEEVGLQIYDLVSMSEVAGVLTICIESESGTKLNVRFPEVVAYRRALESDSLLTLREIGASRVARTSFYIVSNSSYVEWLVDQGHGVREAHTLLHVLVVAVDDVIDVLSEGMPRFDEEGFVRS